MEQIALFGTKISFEFAIDRVEQLDDFFSERPILDGFAFIGRSNVGKSTLINRLCGQKIARTSKTPGRTRQANIFSCEFNIKEAEQTKKLPGIIFDLPGYGHADVSHEMKMNWNQLMSTFFEQAKRKNIQLVTIQDCRHPLTKVDEEFYAFIKPFKLPSVLVFNKLDKLKTQKERHQLEKLKAEIYLKYKKVKQIYFVSAESGDGIEQLKLGLTSCLYDGKQ